MIFEFKGELTMLNKPKRWRKRSTSLHTAHPAIRKDAPSSQIGCTNPEVVPPAQRGEIIVNWSDIPTDAMSLIVYLIGEDETASRSTLKNIRLVNKDWCAAVGSSIQEVACDLDDEGVADRIKRIFPNVTSLTSSRTTDAGIAGIGCLQSLKTLSLSGFDLKSKGLSNLAGLTRLTELHLGCPRMGRHGLKHLSGLSRLASLDLSELPISGNRMVDLSGLKHLVSLKLGPMKELKITRDKDLASLARKRLCH